MKETENTNRTGEARPGGLPCEVVRDLLPLYHDNVVSEASRKAVGVHLDGCAPCRAEYEALCVSLPEPEEASTRGKFSATMRLARRKHWIITALTALVACCLLAVVIAYFYETPMVEIPSEEIETAGAYRFEAGGQDWFFVLFSCPANSGFSTGTYGGVEGEPEALEISWKKSILARNDPDLMQEHAWIFPAVSEAGPCTTLMLNGETIWTEEANGADPVPDYVYTLYEHNKTDLGHGNLCTGVADTVDLEAGFLGFTEEDGTQYLWTLDGTPIETPR